jgi:hypothetical protein
LDSLGKAIEAIGEIIELFKYEQFEYSIETLKWQLESADIPELDKVKIQRDLTRQLEHQELKTTLKRWYQLSLLSLANYALQNIDDTNELKRATKETSEKALKYCCVRLPSSIKEVFELTLYSQDAGYYDKWGLGQWETHPIGRVYSPHTSSYINRILALLFYRAAPSISDKFKASSYKMNHSTIYPFKQDELGIRNEIKSASKSVEVKVVGINPITDEQLGNLFVLFDEIVREANLQKDLELTIQPLSSAIIEEFKNELHRSLKAKSFFRENCELIFQTQKIDWVLQLRQYMDRSYFVENPSYSITMLDSFGEVIANGENEQIFNQILELVPAENHFDDISSGLKKIKEVGIPLDSLTILSTQDFYRDGFLKKQDNFIPKFRLRDRKLPDSVKGIVTFDGLEIPVVEIFVRNQELEQGMVICDLKKISIIVSLDPLGTNTDTGVSVSVVDPIVNSELRDQMLQSRKDILAGVDPALWSQIIGKEVVLDISEQFKVSSSKPGQIFSLRVSSMLDEGHEGDG